MIDFSVVPTNGVRGLWPWLRACLDHLKTKTGDDWLPEDVYRELTDGRMSLILAEPAGGAGGEPGFMVCGVTRDAAGPLLSVWIIYAPGQARYASEWLDFLRASAHRQGCYTIQGGSTRPGWNRLLKRLGGRQTVIWNLPVE